MLVEREAPGDIWSMHDRGHFVVVPTNGVVKENGAAVMGRGLALQAAGHWPFLPFTLGRYLREHGNRVYMISNDEIPDPLHVFTFPVKEDWRAPATLDLVRRSAVELREFIEDYNEETEAEIGTVYLPRVGCGAGGLRWRDVRPTLKFSLERSQVIFVVVHL